MRYFRRVKARRYIGKTRLLLGRFRRAAQLRKNFFFTKDEEFLVLEFDFRTAVLAEKDAIAGLDVQRDQFALLALAGADGDDFALHGLFFCGVRDDDAKEKPMEGEIIAVGAANRDRKTTRLNSSHT